MTTELLNGSRANTRNLVGIIITDHWAIGNHARILDIPANDFCRSCKDSEEIESVPHELSEYPALILGKYFFSSLRELQSKEFRYILSFLREAGWIWSGLKGYPMRF